MEKEQKNTAENADNNPARTPSEEIKKNPPAKAEIRLLITLIMWVSSIIAGLLIFLLLYKFAWD